MGYIIDGNTKTITLTTGTIQVSVRDVWSRWVDWFLTNDNSKFLPAFEQVGGNDIDASQGTKIPIYAFLVNGWKLRPQEANHTLTINDGVLLVNGGGDPFLNTNGAYTVRINYQQPVQAISFNSGGGSSLTKEEIRIEMDTNSVKLNEIHKIEGLDVSNPLVITQTSKITGDIEQILTGDGVTNTTVTRQ
ncbi:MAG TPA: hypothetical protein PLF17_10895 [Chitinophagaceae bacterium]|nr:hypothetical protein [Chitinophagaceae bacterium]HRA71203.1 hypothetical protein [Flavobacterium sp.]